MLAQTQPHQAIIVQEAKSIMISWKAIKDALTDEDRMKIYDEE